MSKSRVVEYFFLQYAPNILSERSTAIAVIFVDPRGPEKGTCTMSIAAGWEGEIRILDPEADLETTGTLLTEIRNRLLSKNERSAMLRELEDSFSNIIRVSHRRKCPVSLGTETFEAFGQRILLSSRRASDSPAAV